MENFKLPTGEEIPVYKPFSLYDAIEQFMAPVHNFRDLLNEVDVEEVNASSLLNVFETLLKEERRLIHSRLAEIEEKLGGQVKTLCAAYTQNVVPPDTLLKAWIDNPRDGETNKVASGEIPDFRTVAPWSREEAQLQRIFVAMRDDPGLLRSDAVAILAALRKTVDEGLDDIESLLEVVPASKEAKEAANEE